MKKFFVLILSLILCLPLVFSGCGAKQQTLGVWWWDSDIDYDTYLDFCYSNGINEIYFCEGELGEKSIDFITKANQKDIDTYWLIGNYQWLTTKRDKLIERVNNFVFYNKTNKNAKYKGIHLDIEPHQDPDWDTNRNQLIYNLIDIVYTLSKDYPTIHFEYDIPFWLEDEIIYRGDTKPAFEHIFDYADRVFIMSYRDSAQGMLSVAEEELSYAKKFKKPIVLGAETKLITETPQVSYYEEGNDFMMQQLDIVKQNVPKDGGVCIHSIKDWYNLAQ